MGVSSWIKPTEQWTSSAVDNLSLECVKISTFYFTNSQNVIIEKPIWSEGITFSLTPHRWTICHQNEEFVIEKFNIDSEILLNETQRSFDIYLCLRKPPNFYIEGIQHPFNFNGRSFNLVLRSSKPLESMSQLRFMLADSTAKIYNIVNVTETYCNINRISRDAVISHDFDKFCVISQWCSKYAAVLPPKLPDTIMRKLNSIPTLEMLELVLLNTVPSRFKELDIVEIDQTHSEFYKQKSAYEISPDYVKLAAITITPSRIIHEPMSLVSKNRIFRYFPKRENFILVKFDNEHDDGNSWRENEIRDHFLRLMKRGIPIDGRTYSFLGCSNSQLQEGRCWFSCLDRNEVYNKIGDFSNFNSAGRKLTRLALAFGASIEIETVPIDLRYWKEPENDIMGGEKNDICFSDGFGRGSYELFAAVACRLDLSEIPSAVQMRVEGAKGVLGLSSQKELLTIKKSMIKFPSHHNRIGFIEVLNISKASPVYLNKIMILMLSDFGISNDIFKKLQQTNITSCINALAAANINETVNFVNAKSSIIDWQSLSSKELMNEPIFKQVKFNQVMDTISEMANKLRICVDDGRALMGVLDEDNVLNYGEIYAHVIDGELDIELDGPVLVFRNPCVLPSDMRVLRARRDVPENFKNLHRNVIVMPAKGPDSHARECAGGDLDGDVFSIVWDQKLIPKNLPFTGKKVIDIETEVDNTFVRPKTSSNVSDEEMMEFFATFQQQNHLGRISNAHLALVDRYGIESKEAMDMARFVVAETDAPRKGLTIGFNFQKLMPEKYPHYMMKSDKESYHSNRIVGKLFDEIQLLVETIRASLTTQNNPMNYLNDWGSQNEVDRYYSMYCYEIAKILQSFHLLNEVDLFSGCPMWKKNRMSDFRRRTQKQKILDAVMKTFWKRWTEKFRRFQTKYENNNKKIQEWYNKPKLRVGQPSSFSLFAFKYVEKSEDGNILDSIRNSTQDWISFRKSDWTDEYKERLKVEEKIRNQLAPIECEMSGLTSLGLHDEFSLLEFSTYANLREVEQSLLSLSSHQKKRRRMSYSSVILIVDSHNCLITNDQNEKIRTKSIANFLDQNRHCWRALRVLLEWARNVRIVESNGSQGLMTTTSFILLFIEYTLEERMEVVYGYQPGSQYHLEDWIESQPNQSDGLKSSQHLIFHFLQMLSSRENVEHVTSLRDPITGMKLMSPEIFEDVQQNAEFSLFVLAVYDGDINKMFELSSKQRVYEISRDLLNPESCDEKLKNQVLRDIRRKSKLENSSQAEFKLITKGRQFLLNVSSKDHREFRKVEFALNNIQKRVNQINISKVKMNSSIIIPEYSKGLETKLKFEPYLGENFYANHANCIRSVAETTDTEIDVINFHWQNTEDARYQERFLEKYPTLRDPFGAKDIFRLSEFNFNSISSIFN